jgi:hypothetical protein
VHVEIGAGQRLHGAVALGSAPDGEHRRLHDSPASLHAAARSGVQISEAL